MRSEQHSALCSDELEALRSCRGASRYETCMYACNVDVIRRLISGLGRHPALMPH